MYHVASQQSINAEFLSTPPSERGAEAFRLGRQRRAETLTRDIFKAQRLGDALKRISFFPCDVDPKKDLVPEDETQVPRQKMIYEATQIRKLAKACLELEWATLVPMIGKASFQTLTNYGLIRSCVIAPRFSEVSDIGTSTQYFFERLSCLAERKWFDERAEVFFAKPELKEKPPLIFLHFHFLLRLKHRLQPEAYSDFWENMRDHFCPHGPTNLILNDERVKAETLPGLIAYLGKPSLITTKDPNMIKALSNSLSISGRAIKLFCFYGEIKKLLNDLEKSDLRIKRSQKGPVLVKIRRRDPNFKTEWRPPQSENKIVGSCIRRTADGSKKLFWMVENFEPNHESIKSLNSFFISRRPSSTPDPEEEVEGLLHYFVEPAPSQTPDFWDQRHVEPCHSALQRLSRESKEIEDQKTEPKRFAVLKSIRNGGDRWAIDHLPEAMPSVEPRVVLTRPLQEDKEKAERSFNKFVDNLKAKTQRREMKLWRKHQLKAGVKFFPEEIKSKTNFKTNFTPSHDGNGAEN